METTLIISIFLVLVIFILLTISKLRNTNTQQENFFNNPSLSPDDSPQSESTTTNNTSPSPDDSPESESNTTNNPSPSPDDSPESESTTTNNPSPSPTPLELVEELKGTGCALYEDLPFPIDAEGKIDYSDLGLSNCYLQQDLLKILQTNIGNVKPTFKYEDKKLIIYMNSFDYNNLTSEIKTNIQNEIKQSVYLFMNQKYKKFKKQDFNIRPDDVKITAFGGSTYIIIEIIPRNKNSGLSLQDIEILEFYNFKNILSGKKPISSIDFLYNTYINNPDISSIISAGDISKLQKQLNTLHLLLLEQNRKSATHTHTSNTRNSISPNPSPSSSNTILAPVNSSPNPSPSSSNTILAPVNSSPNPSPSDIGVGPRDSSPNPSPSDIGLGALDSAPNPSPSNTSLLLVPQPSPSS